MSRLLTLATAWMAMVRGLPWWSVSQIVILRHMIHSAAQKRWGEFASCAYRVGVKLAEAHYAGFNEDVGCSSVPSLAGYNARKGGERSCCGVNVWKRRHLWLGRGELSTSAAPRWRWNEFFCPCSAAARNLLSRAEATRRDMSWH
jgi:hypothetical protein